MQNRRGLPVHQSIGPNNLTAVDLSDALMTQADAQRWAAWSEAGDDIAADARFVWGAGTGRNHDALRIHPLDFIEVTSSLR